MDDLLAHSQLMAHLHGNAPGNNLTFLQGKQPPVMQMPGKYPQPESFNNGTANAPLRYNQPHPNQAAVNQAAMIQAMLQAKQLGMQYGNSNNGISIATAAAAAAAQKTRAAQVAQANQARAMASVLHQQAQKQAQAQAQAQQRLVPPQSSAAAAQNTAWLNAMQRAIASGQVYIENGRPVFAQQANHNPYAAAAAAAAIQQQQAQQLIAAQQQQAQQQQQQQYLMHQLQAALAAQQQQQQAAPPPQQPGNLQAQINHAFSNLWSQQQQQHQQLAQANARQTMASLVANQMPNQMQAMSTGQQSHLHQNQLQQLLNAGTTGDNAAATHALLQAQAQAQALLQAQARTSANLAYGNPNRPSGPAPNAPLGEDPLLASLRLSDQQRLQPQPLHQQTMQGAAQGLVLPRELSPASSGSTSPSTPLAALSHEQRRMALACVALQLVQNDVSVEQAIHSGIMGGMSVTDVKFIIEVHDAHMARIHNHNHNHIQNQQADIKRLSETRPPGLAVSTQRVPTPSSPTPSSSAASETGGAFCRGGKGGAQSAPGSVADEGFDAFSYGFFGGAGGGQTLHELETVAGGGAGSEMIPMWMSDGALTEGATADDEDGEAEVSEPVHVSKEQSSGRTGSATSADGDSRDDVAARLANLDLGYGFF